MKNLTFATIVATVLVLSAFVVKQSVNWKIADSYSIKFTSKDPSGVFTKMNGSILFDENNLQGSKFDVKIDVNSINTGNGMRNKHAKSEKWFDASKYPTIDFTSSKFAKTASGYEVTGTLQIHGVKKEITIPFTFGNSTFAGTFKVNRLDYQVGNPGKASEELVIDVTVPVVKG